MLIRLAIIGAAFILGLGACTNADSAPATAPPTTDAVVTTTTTIVPPTTSTTVPATTTTVDRIAEIEAIFQDLEVRRLQAIMDQDEDAFRAVFANEEYAERSIGGMGLVTVVDPNAAVFSVLQVFVDDPGCIAVEGVDVGIEAIEGASEGQPADHVIERVGDGWGLSWIGSGWRCDGPHPFSD